MFPFSASAARHSRPERKYVLMRCISQVVFQRLNFDKLLLVFYMHTSTDLLF